MEYTEPMEAIRRLASALGIEMDAVRLDSREGWDGIHFQVTLTADAGPAFSSPYSVGGAIPILWAQDMAKRSAGSRKKLRTLIIDANPGIKAPTSDDIESMPAFGRVSLRDDETRRAVLAAYTPPMADVLQSLAMDASGFPTSFRDWSEEYAHDMNPADALDSYHACERTYAWLARVFRGDLGALMEAAHDA